MTRSRRTVVCDAERQGVAQIHNVDPQMSIHNVDADLVVIENRGTIGIERFVLGSVPDKVAPHCPSSVLIVNTDAP